MILTTEVLAHCYDMVVAASPTLQRWNLPPSEDIKFKIIKHKDRYGHHEVIGGVHHIAISSVYVTKFETLISTLVHEAIHIHQDRCDLPRADNKVFSKFADKLCRELMLDRGTF
jgi:hypothetical protein